MNIIHYDKVQKWKVKKNGEHYRLGEKKWWTSPLISLEALFYKINQRRR